VQERVFFGRIFAAVISIDKTKRVGGGCQPVTDGAAGGSQPGIVFVVRDCKPGNKMLHYAINVSMQVNSGRVESMVPGALTASVGLPLWQNCGNICLPRLRISFVFFFTSLVDNIIVSVVYQKSGVGGRHRQANKSSGIARSVAFFLQISNRGNISTGPE
jgi:hypothetical protein